MKKSILAIAIFAATAAAYAQTQASPTAPAKPAAEGKKAPPSEKPEEFAKKKAELAAALKKAGTCVDSAAERKAVKECMNAMHESMKEMRPHHPMDGQRPDGATAGRPAPTTSK